MPRNKDNLAKVIPFPPLKRKRFLLRLLYKVVLGLIVVVTGIATFLIVMH